eukprot:4989998-Amphidinium_carterae.1
MDENVDSGTDFYSPATFVLSSVLSSIQPATPIKQETNKIGLQCDSVAMYGAEWDQYPTNSMQRRQVCVTVESTSATTRNHPRRHRGKQQQRQL